MIQAINTKVLISGAVVLAAAALIIGATFAFFSDTETSTGNTFVAGDIDLKIDNESFVTDFLTDENEPTGAIVFNGNTSWGPEPRDLTVEKFFNFEDLKPGDFGEDTISIHVGSNNAWLCAAAQITEDADNDITDPEDEVGGPAGQDGTTDGDLDSGINFAFWKDDGDNVFEPVAGTNEGVAETIFLSGPLSGLGVQGKIALSDSSGGPFGSSGVEGGSTSYIGKAWCYGTLTPGTLVQDGANNLIDPTDATGFTCDGSGVGNIGQTDSVVGDLQFFAIQQRNNPTFTCAQNYIPSWD